MSELAAPSLRSLAAVPDLKHCCALMSFSHVASDKTALLAELRTLLPPFCLKHRIRRLDGFGSGAHAGWIAKNRDRFLKTDGVLATLASIGVWLAQV